MSVCAHTVSSSNFASRQMPVGILMRPNELLSYIQRQRAAGDLNTDSQVSGAQQPSITHTLCYVDG